MKAISIQQPWAWAILHAGKDVENRSWSTAHRGLVAVHATRLQTGWTFPPGVAPPTEHDLVLGSIVGVVEIADVVTHSASPWFIGPKAFVLRHPRPLKAPIPCKGDLHFWALRPTVARQVRSELQRRLRITDGNVRNHHMNLAGALDLFPDEALGGPTLASAGLPVRVVWGSEVAETDIVRAKKIFRRRGWVRRFFSEHHIRAGDQVLLERLEAYLYRVTKFRESAPLSR